MTTTRTTEKRAFGMHPKLLRDVIMRQSGTLEKALMEGGMNAIEAGATEVEITVDPERFRIKDNGRGFRSKEEVEKFFEMFGQPHDESEGKIWAEFRMGRGQMFAFGKNVWRTGSFEMRVNINELGDGLGYELLTHEESHDGCEIDVEFFEVISDSDIYRITREIDKYMKWVGVPVTVNGKLISKAPDEGKWTDDDDDAWMSLNSSETGAAGIKVYNLGVYVMEIPRYHHGVGGTIVSKKRLTLNFARNDILKSKCPVWKRIAKTLGEAGAVKTVAQKRKFSDAERSSLIHKFNAGEDCPDGRPWTKVPFLLDTSGHPLSFTMALRNAIYTVAPQGDQHADALQQRGLMLCLDSDNVAEFDCGVKDFLDWFKIRSSNYHWVTTPKFSPWEEARETLDSSHYIVPEDDLTELERVWVEALTDMQYGWRSKTHRKIMVGESESADAWTDGSTYIAFNRRWLGSHALINRGRAVFSSVMAASLLLAHELCHDDNSLTQGHTPDFYREYHDMHDAVTWAADKIFRSFNEPGIQQKAKARAKKAKEAATRRKARARKAKEKARQEEEKAAKAARKKTAKRKTTKKAKIKVAARTKK